MKCLRGARSSCTSWLCIKSRKVDARSDIRTGSGSDRVAGGRIIGENAFSNARPDPVATAPGSDMTCSPGFLCKVVLPIRNRAFLYRYEPSCSQKRVNKFA